jgi:hypothetical protein
MEAMQQKQAHFTKNKSKKIAAFSLDENRATLPTKNNAIHDSVPDWQSQE